MIQNGTEGIFQGAKVLHYSNSWFSIYFVRFSFDNDECATTLDIEKIRSVFEGNPDDYDYLLISTFNDEIKELLKEKGYPEDKNLIKLKNE